MIADMVEEENEDGVKREDLDEGSATVSATVLTALLTTLLLLTALLLPTTLLLEVSGAFLGTESGDVETTDVARAASVLVAAVVTILWETVEYVWVGPPPLPPSWSNSSFPL